MNSARDLHNSLISEFGKALDLLEQQYDEHGCEPWLEESVAFLAALSRQSSESSPTLFIAP